MFADARTPDEFANLTLPQGLCRNLIVDLDLLEFIESFFGFHAFNHSLQWRRWVRVVPSAGVRGTPAAGSTRPEGSAYSAISKPRVGLLQSGYSVSDV